MTDTCDNGHGEVPLVETDEGLKCPICQDVTMYTEDRSSSESSSVGTDSDTENEE